ncbi:MAG: hypothetical protein EOP48_17035 [Sphingobacteriales bacterium]|nr:MAG: hypothetical protein EOP48_17035 [Sphingobacteriales bacterium]
MYKFTKGVFIAIGTAVIFLLNYCVFENLIIPDPCYYHNRDTGILFELFFDTPSFNGGHPFPSKVNFIVTMAAGITISWATYNVYFSRFKEFVKFGLRNQNAQNLRK